MLNFVYSDRFNGAYLYLIYIFPYFQLLVSLCLIAAASAAPPNSKGKLAALRAQPAVEHVDVRDEFGQYSLRYVTAEGTVVTETGRLVPTADGTDYVLVTDKEVSYVGEDGKTYTTKYTAGVDGVKIEGSHIPVIPEPEAAENPDVADAEFSESN